MLTVVLPDPCGPITLRSQVSFEFARDPRIALAEWWHVSVGEAALCVALCRNEGVCYGHEQVRADLIAAAAT